MDHILYKSDRALDTPLVIPDIMSKYHKIFEELSKANSFKATISGILQPEFFIILSMRNASSLLALFPSR